MFDHQYTYHKNNRKKKKLALKPKCQGSLSKTNQYSHRSITKANITKILRLR